MNNRLLEIRLRRAELRGLIADQREQVAAFSERWQGAFRVADKGMSILSFLRSQPLITGILMAGIVKRRRDVWRVTKASLGLWKSWGVIRSIVDGMNAARGASQR